MEQTPLKPRRGCLFYGGVIAFVCVLAILIAGFLGVYQFRKMLREYTDTQPMPLPEVAMTPETFDRLTQRVEDFRDDLRAGRSTTPLILSADEVNALIARDPELKQVKGKVYVLLDGDRLSARISFPMEDLGLPRFRGRYLNGNATLGLDLQNGLLYAWVQNFSAKGKPVPPAYLNVIRRQNLAARANDNARASVALNLLQSITVTNSQLVVVPRNNQ